MNVKIERIFEAAKLDLAFGDDIKIVAYDESNGRTVNNFVFVGVTNHGAYVDVPQHWNVRDIDRIGNVLFVRYKKIAPSQVITDAILSHGLCLFDGSTNPNWDDIERAINNVTSHPEWQICCTLPDEQQAYVAIVGGGKLERAFTQDVCSFVRNGHRLVDVDFSWASEVPGIPELIANKHSDPFWDQWCYSELITSHFQAQQISVTRDCPGDWKRNAKRYAVTHNLRYVEINRDAQ